MKELQEIEKKDNDLMCCASYRAHVQYTSIKDLIFLINKYYSVKECVLSEYDKMDYISKYEFLCYISHCIKDIRECYERLSNKYSFKYFSYIDMCLLELKLCLFKPVEKMDLKVFEVYKELKNDKQNT